MTTPEFDRRDQRALLELEHELGQLRADGARAFDAFLPAFTELLHLEKGVIYEVRQEPSALSLGATFLTGMTISHRRLTDEFDAMLRATPRRWGLFNPARPEPKQRNVPLTTPPIATFLEQLHRSGSAERFGMDRSGEFEETLSAVARSIALFARLELDQEHQFRVLVCQDDSLLAWVGGYSKSPPTPRTIALLQALVPALQRRLSIDRLLERAPLVEAALQATLEQLPRAAFIVSDSGAVLYANSAGEAELNRSRRGLRAALTAAIDPKGPPTGYSVTPVLAKGRAKIHLLIATKREDSNSGVAELVRKLELTPRQAEVLQLLVTGEANKGIAAKLQCATRTVEMHVTALLDKAGVTSRAELIARFFLGG